MVIKHSAKLTRRTHAADVVIIGAGAAGLAVVSRVRALGGTAIVVESGGYNPAPDRLTGRASAVGQLPYFDLSDCRPRGLGGSTTLWGGWCEPFDALDFEARPLYEETGWCVSASALAPYYDQALAFCSIPRERPSRQWARADNLHSGDWLLQPREFPVLGPRQLGHRHAGLFDGDAIDLLLGATVTRIATTTDGGAVDHLVVATSTGDLTVSGNRFVLAAGGIETTRVLLCSGSPAWPTGLGNRSDMVGRCFMDHPHVDAMRLRGDHARFDVDFFLEHEAGRTLTGEPMAAAGCLLLSDAGCRTHNVGRVQLFIEPAGGHRSHPLPRLWNGRPVRFAPDRVEPDELAVIAAVEQVPNRRSRIVLGDTRDPLGMPQPVLRWNLHEQDHRTAVVATELLRPFLAHLGATRVRRRIRSDRWPMDTVGAPHHLGTARMARSASDGVVDEHCRVHDVDNLFVAGGAVFPTSGHAPPTLTIIALAMRLGDRLCQRTSEHASEEVQATASASGAAVEPSPGKP